MPTFEAEWNRRPKSYSKNFSRVELNLVLRRQRSLTEFLRNRGNKGRLEFYKKGSMTHKQDN